MGSEPTYATARADGIAHPVYLHECKDIKQKNGDPHTNQGENG